MPAIYPIGQSAGHDSCEAASDAHWDAGETDLESVEVVDVVELGGEACRYGGETGDDEAGVDEEGAGLFYEQCKTSMTP